MADSQQIYLQCLTNFETYAETIWHTASYPGAPPDSGYWGDGGNSGNGGIRGNSGIAVAYATLAVALPNDPRTATRLSRIRQALNYDAATHVTGTYSTVNGGKWGWSSGSPATCTSQSGADWQSALWAGSMGLACLLVQSNLPNATVQAVQAAVASEADHRAAIPPCTRDLSSGDTKAEENAWDGNILALAAAWMSTSNSAPTWLTAAKSYLANTYTVADTAGDPLSNWISTVTMYPEFALENHGFYHPTYEMVAGMSSGDSLLMAKLADPNVAAQLLPFAEHNVQIVWSTNLSLMLLDSGEFAYPSGLDWELHDYEQDSYITWMAAHFNDPLARWADTELAQLVRYRQIINGNGEFVGTSGGGFYREAVEARRTAIAWLQWANADFPTGVTNPPAPAVALFPDVGVIAQRSRFGFVSISYKDTIMGMVEAASASIPSNTFVATPALPGGFGNGSLGNATSASLVSFTTNNAGFFAQLLLQDGANGQTRVYMNSCGESVGIVEIPLPASGVNGTSAGCFTNGIENDPLTGGTRLVEWNDGSVIITNRTGVSTNIDSQWVCISQRYGVATGPGGSFQYHAASGYNRPGAAQDYLNVIPQTRLGARYCVWFPSKNATQTASLASQISWTTNGSTVVLNFPGNGGTQTIIASIAPSGSGTWSADASGNWSDSSKWSGGNIADGAGNTADFSTIDITADRTVTLDSSRSIGALKFGDASGAQNWTLNSSAGSSLTLDSGSTASPTISVAQNTAMLNLPLTGSNGFTKSNPGTLILSGSNSLSGTLYVDTGSNSKNDGAVRVTSSAALANLDAISMGNNSAASAASTFQLDGANGNIVVLQPVTSSCRANSIPSVENLDGNNVLAGPFFMKAGGTNVALQCDEGTLTFAGPLQYIDTLTAARSFNFFGAGGAVVDGAILDSLNNNAPISVGKFDSGTLTLNGTNTYDGGTSVNGGKLVVNGRLANGLVTVADGTLSGNGTINGPVTVQPDGILSPGNDAIGTLTIANALTNAGVLSIRLGKSGGVLTNDAIAGLGSLVYGGTLQLMTLGDQVTAGDRFKLFDATSYSGSFNNIIPATPGVGLAWDTNNLLLDGTLAVVLGMVKPRVARISMGGTNLIWSGNGGAAAAGYSVLETTNLALPITAWDVVGAGVFDTNGNFTVTNELTSDTSQRFYTIRIP